MPSNAQIWQFHYSILFKVACALNSNLSSTTSMTTLCIANSYLLRIVHALPWHVQQHEVTLMLNISGSADVE